MTSKNTKLAYFCMEFAMEPGIPNYAGGLGILSADILKSMADLGVPAVGITLMYHLNDDPEHAFIPGTSFKKRPETIKIHIEDRNVTVGVWEYQVKGEKGSVPLYFLDTNLPENKRWDRDITKDLYAGDRYTRLCQEAVLGIAGIRMLRALGCHDVEVYHMNEGHSSLLTLELLKEADFKDETVREHCVFTTHTPIPAGHDSFEYKMAHNVLGAKVPWHIEKLAGKKDLNMTKLALRLSKKANGVSKKHAEVCKKMFPDFDFESVVNGVHLGRWVSDPLAAIFDEHLKGWRQDPAKLMAVVGIPDEAIREAREKSKKTLVQYINSQSEFFPIAKENFKNEDWFDGETLTITFARRFVPYKRPLLLFSDLEQLRSIGSGKIQLIFAGPYHTDNEFAMEIINQLHRHGLHLHGDIRLAILPDYDLSVARLLTQGSDVWLNTPTPPLEASGTSGMKAAVNGGLNVSILDGWWIEGYEKNPKSGWAFNGESSDAVDIEQNKKDADSLYRVFEEAIDCYENKPDEWMERVKQAITLGAYFNTHRCVKEYEEKMYNK
jgi:starch phosphorylase